MNEQSNDLFIITSSEFLLIKNKNNDIKLAFAILLKYFAIYFRFLDSIKKIPENLVEEIAYQLELDERH